MLSSGALQVLGWPIHQRALKRMNRLEEFFVYVEPRAGGTKFLAYQQASGKKRAAFLSVLSAIAVDPLGINFLDLGPGYGETLDACFERGAKSVSFTEIAPFFYHFNRLKKFTTPHHLNHLFSLHRLPARKFKLISCKGAVVADHAILSQRLPFRKWRFSSWITQLEQLAAPGANILLCPHWRSDGTHRRVEDTRTCVLSTLLLSCGYTNLPQIPGHNHEPEYPLTYHKALP
jgi:hypothetical protein